MALYIMNKWLPKLRTASKKHRSISVYSIQPGRVRPPRGHFAELCTHNSELLEWSWFEAATDINGTLIVCGRCAAAGALMAWQAIALDGIFDYCWALIFTRAREVPSHLHRAQAIHTHTHTCRGARADGLTTTRNQWLQWLDNYPNMPCPYATSSSIGAHCAARNGANKSGQCVRNLLKSY